MKIKLIIGFFVLAIVSFGYYRFNVMKVDQVTLNQKDLQSEKIEPSNESSTDGTKTNIVQKKSSITISVDPPINGTRKGVIEVGASGFNMFIVDIDKDKNWELVSSHFGKSLAWEGFANTEDIYLQTKDYISEMAERGVAGRNIHFVMSSGALKAKGIDKVKTAIQQKGFIVNAVTPDQEGKYALRASLPKSYIDNSYVVDIGSGNTKISWYEEGSLKTVESYGAKYSSGDKSVSSEECYSAVKSAALKIPESKRSKCFIIGGVPFKLAEQVRNEKERFTLLKGPEYYSAGDNEKVRNGLNIYRAISDATGTSEFIFDWDANFTIGFLLTLN